MTDAAPTEREPRTAAAAELNFYLRGALIGYDEGAQRRIIEGATEYIARIEEEAAASPPATETGGLDPGLAAIYLAAAMKEVGFRYDTKTASDILDYLQADSAVVLARLASGADREDTP